MLLVWALFSMVNLGPYANAEITPITSRIINGEPVTAAYPWIGPLHQAGSDPSAAIGGIFCSATLIRPQYAITAAHCVYPYRNTVPSPIAVTFGRTNLSSVETGTTVGIAEILIHPNYNDYTLVYDVAVLRLVEPVPYSPAAVIYPGASTSGITAPGSILGWGITSNESTTPADRLQQAAVTLQSNEVCTDPAQGGWGNLYNPDGSINPNGYFDPTSMICAGKRRTSYFDNNGIDACIGDSGGPLSAALSDGSVRIIGITSFGAQYCGTDWYGVYARLEPVAGWIATVTAAPPRSLSNPSIIGTAKVGNQLQCVNGSWDVINAHYTYRFEDGSANTLQYGAETFYTLSAADAGKRVRCAVLAQNPYGSSSAASDLTAAVTDDQPPIVNQNDMRAPRVRRITKECANNVCLLRVTVVDPVKNSSGVKQVGALGDWWRRTCSRATGRRVCVKETAVLAPMLTGQIDGVFTFSVTLPGTGRLHLAIVAGDWKGNLSRPRHYRTVVKF